jgi:hypothetical protein
VNIPEDQIGKMITFSILETQHLQFSCVKEASIAVYAVLHGTKYACAFESEISWLAGGEKEVDIFLFNAISWQLLFARTCDSRR